MSMYTHLHVHTLVYTVLEEMYVYFVTVIHWSFMTSTSLIPRAFGKNLCYGLNVPSLQTHAEVLMPWVR